MPRAIHNVVHISIQGADAPRQRPTRDLRFLVILDDFLPQFVFVDSIGHTRQWDVVRNQNDVVNPFAAQCNLHCRGMHVNAIADEFCFDLVASQNGFDDAWLAVILSAHTVVKMCRRARARLRRAAACSEITSG